MGPWGRELGFILALLALLLTARTAMVEPLRRSRRVAKSGDGSKRFTQANSLRVVLVSPFVLALAMPARVFGNLRTNHTELPRQLIPTDQ